MINLLYISRAQLIMDDEKYFCFDGDSTSCSPSNRYYTNDKAKFSDDIRFIG